LNIMTLHIQKECFLHIEVKLHFSESFTDFLEIHFETQKKFF
jgi:hypothetical protein